MSVTRLVRLGDAAPLAAALRVSRDFLRPWEPIRPEEYFTEAGQLAVLTAVLEQHRQGYSLPLAVTDADDRPVGRATVNNIVGGPFQSGSLGYWVGADHGGRGLATAAVGEAVRAGFDDLRLHRIEAGTLVHNARSQRVLEKNGFTRYGLAPAYLQIAGRWQDHVLFQRLNPDWDG